MGALLPRLAGGRCSKGDESLEVNNQRKLKGHRTIKPLIRNGWEGAFSQKNGSDRWEHSCRMTAIMPKGLQGDLWAMAEGTEAVYSGALSGAY